MPIPTVRSRVGFPGSVLLLFAAGCVPAIPPDPTPRSVPAAFADATERDTKDTTGSGVLEFRRFFRDSTLVALIDTAMRQNPEGLAALQEIEMARNELQAVRGRLAPQVVARASLGVDKVGRYTAEGAGNASTEMTPGVPVAEPLPDINLGFLAGWEVDIRGKIRNQRGAALSRYLGSVEGRRYVLTALVAEVANTYYELTALDAKLAIIREAIDVQRRQLDVVKAQKEAAVVSELAVQRFEALQLNARGMEYEVRQEIQAAENRMNRLLGRLPQPVPRAPVTAAAEAGLTLAGELPSQLLRRRPDIRHAELEVEATRFDVRAARAEFYPEINLVGGLGVNAFKSSVLWSTPESMAFSLAGDVLAPLLNRRAITAELGRASANQRRALFDYQRTVLEGFSEVATLISAIGNLDSLYAIKTRQAQTLDRSVGIANDLFTSAHADYLEVLTVQREAIDAKLEVIETHLRQQVATTNLYRAFGGGWR